MSKREMLVGFLRRTVDEEFDPDQDSLLDVMDSVTFLQLVVFIEQEMDIRLDMSMVGLESFASVDSLMDTITDQVAA